MAKKKDHKYQLFNKLRPEEYAALEADIAKRGVQVAVELDENGDVLDGHNRKEIADKLGKKYKTITRKFKTEQEKREHVIKLNIARRHMEPHEWGMAFKMLLEERGVKRGKPGPKLPKSTDAETVSASVNIGDVAAELGVDDRTARNRMKAADDYESLTASEKKAIDSKETTITKVKAERRKKKTKAAEVKAAKAAKTVPKGKPWIVTNKQAIVPCNALVTDPPYGILDEDWEPAMLEEFTRDWATRWAKCGADLIATFWSQRWLWEGRRWFDESFAGYAFQHLLVWHYPNNKSPQSQQGFKHTWEPVFLYRRDGADRKITVGGDEWGKDLTDFDCHVAAVPQSNFKDENMKQHPAQKPVSVMRWIVNALTIPGELVCDPFCGSGTTGIAAVQLGRRFHGIEKHADYADVAKGRIATYGKAGV